MQLALLNICVFIFQYYHFKTPNMQILFDKGTNTLNTFGSLQPFIRICSEILTRSEFHKGFFSILIYEIQYNKILLYIT